MLKQYFKKSDGEVFLFDSSEINEQDILTEYTEIMPPQGLYRPIYFDGEKWVGTPYEKWLEANPQIEVEEAPDDKDVLIADLTVQLLTTQEHVKTLEKDFANLTIQFLEEDI